jgi:hypothetical protein
LSIDEPTAVLVERLWHCVKYQRACLRANKTVGDAHADLKEYFYWHSLKAVRLADNLNRGHMSVNDQTLNQAYWQLLPTMQKAA